MGPMTDDGSDETDVYFLFMSSQIQVFLKQGPGKDHN